MNDQQTGTAEIVLTRTVAAPRDRVFAALTGAAHLPHWFGPPGWELPVCEIDLRPGGARRLVSRRPSGAELELRGVYAEVTAPRRLAYTESYDHDPEGLGELLIAIDLDERDGGTTITTTIRYESVRARDLELERVPEGWSASFDRLDAHLRTMAAR